VAEACEAASRLVKDVTRAADIIGRISSLFKKGALQRELVDVNELIREMIVLLRSEANRYSISIRTELAEGFQGHGRRVQLQQVFMNLMLNGIDAMRKRPAEVNLPSSRGLRCSAADLGQRYRCGIAPEQAEQIFKAFFTTKDNGTGMGLPISRQSLSRMAVACGPPMLPRAVQLFSSPCPPRPRRTHNLLSCSNMVANRRFPFGLSHCQTQ